MPRKKPISKKIEEIYCNRRFVPPKEQSLETIFEEPRQSKEGLPILTSVKKYKRYLHFDPSQNKIQKRKQKAKKCLNKLKLNIRVTRSSPQSTNSDDVSSLRMLDNLDDSSNDGDMDVSLASNTSEVAIDTTQISTAYENSPNSEKYESQSHNDDFSETPKRNDYKRRPSVLLERGEGLTDTTDEAVKKGTAETTEESDAEESGFRNVAETVESPRRSCFIS